MRPLPDFFSRVRPSRFSIAMQTTKTRAVTPAMIRAIEKQAVVGHLRLLRSTCSTRAQHGGLMCKFKCLLRTGSHWTWRGTAGEGGDEGTSSDGEEGVLGVVVLPIGDQLSLCAGCLDISLRLHPRQSLFHSGGINLLSSMDYLHTIYLRDWIIFSDYSISCISSYHTFSLQVMLLYSDILYTFVLLFFLLKLVFFAVRTMPSSPHHALFLLPAYTGRL